MIQPLRPDELPARIWHGSAYRQDQLRPGILHHGNPRFWNTPKQKRWGWGESNYYLYASTRMEVAEHYAATRALENSPWKLRHAFQGDLGLVLEFTKPVEIAQLGALEAYVYGLDPQMPHCWSRNQHLGKQFDPTEYRTRRAVPYTQMYQLDLEDWLERTGAVIYRPYTP
jgi:hypothetical protein